MRQFENVVKAIQFIEDHLREMVSVPDVAQHVGISSWHFQRVFFDTIGETIGSYLRRRRLTCALEDLRQTNRPLLDLALEYQFGSAEAFSRSFKSEFGMSPQHFRASRVSIVPFKRPVLEPTEISYLAERIELKPEIRQMDSLTIVGLPVSFASPLAKRLEYMSEIPGIWREFVRRESEIPYKLGTVKVGVIEGMAKPRHHIHEDRMDYLAGTPVLQLRQVPHGFEAITIPAGTYAVFKAMGYHEQTQFIIDHVYSGWLPKSGYERTEGPEFTWLDHRVAPLDSIHSVVEYFLPVHPILR